MRSLHWNRPNDDKNYKYVKIKTTKLARKFVNHQIFCRIRWSGWMKFFPLNLDCRSPVWDSSIKIDFDSLISSIFRQFFALFQNEPIRWASFFLFSLTFYYYLSFTLIMWHYGFFRFLFLNFQNHLQYTSFGAKLKLLALK